MKKIFALMLVVMLVLPAVSMAGSWTAVKVTGASSSGPNDTVSVLSNNVTLAAVSNDNQYAAISGHTNGNKLYGGTSGDTKLYSNPTDPVSVTAPSDSDTAQFDTSADWSPL
jgi:hypothetical protein